MKNTITFDLREIMQLIKIETDGKPNSQPYLWADDTLDPTPQHGLNLVGDHGIYFMPNTKDQKKTENGMNTVAYAAECDPGKLENPELYDAKREIFGGDDMAIFFPMKAIIGWIHRGKYQVSMDEEEVELI